MFGFCFKAVCVIFLCGSTARETSISGKNVPSSVDVVTGAPAHTLHVLSSCGAEILHHLFGTCAIGAEMHTVFIIFLIGFSLIAAAASLQV